METSKGEKMNIIESKYLPNDLILVRGYGLCKVEEFVINLSEEKSYEISMFGVNHLTRVKESAIIKKVKVVDYD